MYTLLLFYHRERLYLVAKTGLFVFGKVCKSPCAKQVSKRQVKTKVMVSLDGALIQTIPHPCTSVWSVTALPDGDIASGGSDSVIRVFTRRAEAVADANTIKVLVTAVAYNNLYLCILMSLSMLGIQ